MKYLLAFILACACAFTASCVYSPHVMTIQQRGVICNTQDYDPATAATDIKLCRMGLTKQTGF